MLKKTAPLYKIIQFFIITGVAIFILAGCGIISYETDNSYGTENLPDLNAEKASIAQNRGQEINGMGSEPLKVEEVIDGDTFLLENGECIRLLGINAPEVDRYFYEEAKNSLDYMIEGQKVKLERDITDRDQYGRMLRYVYFAELFVNLEMVKRGFANVFTMAPDVKYQGALLDAERYAMKNNTGLWRLSEYNSGKSLNRSSSEKIKIEMNADADGNDRENLNGEFVLFSNNSGSRINISGWTVKDSGTNIFEFNSYVFQNGSQIVLYSGYGYEGNGFFYWNSKTPVWNNDHDTLYLRDREGFLIAVLSY